jgi:hypothetical protein
MPHPTPQTMSEIRHEMINWFKVYAPQIWPQQHLAGSKFVAPPCLPPIRARVGGLEISARLNSAMYKGDQRTIEQFRILSDYYARTLEEAKTYYIGEELSNLALRTEMQHYRLTADMLPSPSGFLVWAMPIGDAEKFSPRDVWVNANGTITEEVEEPVDRPWAPFLNADSPVIGVSWRYEKDYDTVWVVFYTNNDAVRLAMGLSPQEMSRAREYAGAIAFEREQALPLDQTLNWFDADPADGPRLTLTADTDITSLPDERKALGEQRNAEARGSLTNMCRVLVATFMLMKWKIANREEIPAPPYAVKQIARDTGRPRAEVRAENKTVFVRLGQPLRHRKPKEGAKSGKWTVRAIVGPYIRTRQYIPAHDRYDDTPRLIEPYIAGPEGAPISNADKVFLLD